MPERHARLLRDEDEEREEGVIATLKIPEIPSPQNEAQRRITEMKLKEHVKSRERRRREASSVPRPHQTRTPWIPFRRGNGPRAARPVAITTRYPKTYLLRQLRAGNNLVSFCIKNKRVLPSHPLTPPFPSLEINALPANTHHKKTKKDGRQ